MYIWVIFQCICGYHIKGTIPNSVCLLTHLTELQLTSGNSNPGITCGPLCVSSVSSLSVPSSICVYPQDMGLCGFIAATNIQSLSGYSQWSCTTLGVTTTSPCVQPYWTGLNCSGINVVSIVLKNISLTGTNLFHMID